MLVIMQNILHNKLILYQSTYSQKKRFFCLSYKHFDNQPRKITGSLLLEYT